MITLYFVYEVRYLTLERHVCTMYLCTSLITEKAFIFLREYIIFFIIYCEQMCYYINTREGGSML
jgi:hypothetical protein